MIRTFSLMLLGAVFFSAPAYAHVTANPDNGIAGKYFQTDFRISHGCEGSNTVSVSVKIPPGIVSLKPQAKAGWEVEIKKSKLDKPVSAGHGKMATEQFDEIIWSGGSLPDDQYDTFGVLMKLPSNEGILWFPVKQTCEKGTESWTNVPANMDKWHDTDHPAPFVKITLAPATDEHHH